MGFFGLAPPPSRKAPAQRGVSVELLHKTECRSCPLNGGKGCEHPKIEPMGGKKPLIYMLGHAPSEVGDRRDEPWAGKLAQYIKKRMPSALSKADLRWNNVIRTYPGPGPDIATKDKDVVITLTRDPTFVEIECCRPSIVRDIEESKPRAIFGFGAVPLKWAANETHAYLWMGKRIPVKIGKHECWYYPFITPDFILKDKRGDWHSPEWEPVFERHLRNAVKQVLDEHDSEPVIHTPDVIEAGVKWVWGANGWDDVEVIKKHLRAAKKAKSSGLDYETNKLRPFEPGAKLLSAAVSIPDSTLAFAIEHKGHMWTADQQEAVMNELADYLYDAEGTKIVHQLAFEMEWSAEIFGKDVLRSGRWDDTLSQAYIMGNPQGLLGLEQVCVEHFGFNIKEYSPVDRKNLENEPVEAVLKYNAIDAKYHRNAFIKQRPLLQDMGMVPQYEHQLQRIPTLVLTQMRGIDIDQRTVKDFGRKYEDAVADALEDMKSMPEWARFKRLHDAELRPSATPDIIKLLKMMGLKTTTSEKGNTKGASTEVDQLMRFKHPFINALIKWRKNEKMLSTYVKPISTGSPLLVDGCIHPIISATKVKTWRTSSEDPNIQNWPKRSERAEIRKTVKREGFKVVSFDFAGIQARNVAMESRDKKLTDSFITGYDIHAEWSEWLAKEHPPWAPKGMGSDKNVFKGVRAGVKNQFVFPTFFGAAPTGISKNLQNSGTMIMPVKVVEKAQEKFFSDFPGIKKWHERLKAFYEKNGYVTGLSGHRRYAPVSYNEVINTPIQADESLIVMSAMNALSELDHEKYQASMMIHDDLTFIWPKSQVEKRAEIVIREMTRVRFDWINTPLEIEMLVGDSWGDQKEVGKFKNVMGGKPGEYVEITHG
jgi:DNA polymerase I-like protein with 3'-5' exonuclease and polymerase domains/uracil-DNA glycosylase